MTRDFRTRKIPVSDRADETGPIVVIFHPGKGAVLRDVKKQLSDLAPQEERLQVFIGSRHELATLISPLGVFRGADQVKDGLIALKNVMNYII